MKIAVATEDKVNVGQHFAGSPYIMVITVENGEIVKREIRENIGHSEFAGEESHPQTDETGRHGFGEKAEERHKKQLEILNDCDVLISGMMGTGAYNFFKDSGLDVITTDVKSIDEVISLYTQGKLKHMEQRLD